MNLIFPTKEDKLKLKVSSKVSSDMDVSEYTRECMSEYSRVSHKKEKISLVGESISLEEKLIGLICQREEVGEILKRRIDERAWKLIKRGCKKNLGLVRKYYRAYKHFRMGGFYIDEKEEDFDGFLFDSF
jgi:hypothetical protein